MPTIEEVCIEQGRAIPVTEMDLFEFVHFCTDKGILCNVDDEPWWKRMRDQKEYKATFTCKYCGGTWTQEFNIGDLDICPGCDADLWDARQMVGEMRAERERYDNEY